MINKTRKWVGGTKVIDFDNLYMYGYLQFVDTVNVFRFNLFYKYNYDICYGDTARIQPFNNYSSYHWSTGGSAPFIAAVDSGKYFLTATDKYGNIYYDSVKVNIHKPVVNLGRDTAIYYGKYILLTPGYNFSGYVWNLLDNNGKPVTNPYFYYRDTVKKDTTVYIKVTVYDTYGCSNLDSIKLTLHHTLNAVTSIKSENEFILYPNPGEGKVFIKTNLNKSDFVIIKIFSSDSREVYYSYFKNSTDNIPVDISGIPKGLYFISFTTNDINITRKLIIK